MSKDKAFNTLLKTLRSFIEPDRLEEINCNLCFSNKQIVSRYQLRDDEEYLFCEECTIELKKK